MVENTLIWHVVVYGQFRCVALVLVASYQNSVMSDHRKNFFRWLLSVLFCCWNSSNSFAENNGNNRRICVTEHIEMGPMTLRDYINTLEQYDPEKHGWRGEEPWRYRMRYRDQQLTLQSIHLVDECRNSCSQRGREENVSSCDLKKTRRIKLPKFGSKNKDVVVKSCSMMMKMKTRAAEVVVTEGKTIEQPSIHQLRQTINLLQIILLKLVGAELTNTKT